MNSGLIRILMPKLMNYEEDTPFADSFSSY